MLVITIWLHFANKGVRAFFFQERSRNGAKIFKMIKFKTMTDERDAVGNLLPKYLPEKMRRYEVRPGISGWAQW